MKRIFLSILATVALTFSACEKNEPNNPNNPENPNQPGIENTENLAVTVNPDGTTSTGAPFQWIDGSHNSQFLLNYIKYKVDYANTQIFITGAEEKGLRDVMKGKALIPKTITINNVSYPITLVEKRAFYQCKDIKSINIPEGVTKIEESAFEECTNLTAAQLYNGLLEIEANAFKSCENLEFIQLPNSLTALGEYAFANCYKMELFSEKLPTIGKYVKEGVFLNCASIKKIIIPKKVEKIEDFAFKGCSSLEEVSMKDSYIDEIGESAFEDCTSLKQIDFHDSSMHIWGHKIFRNCKSLEYIFLPHGVDYLPKACFQGCSTLKTVKYNKYLPGLSNGLTSLGAYAFDGCTSLERLVLSDRIGGGDWTGLFRNCTSLKELAIAPADYGYGPLRVTASENAFENVYLDNLVLNGASFGNIPKVRVKNVYNSGNHILSVSTSRIRDKFEPENVFGGCPGGYSFNDYHISVMFNTVSD